MIYGSSKHSSGSSYISSGDSSGISSESSSGISSESSFGISSGDSSYIGSGGSSGIGLSDSSNIGSGSSFGIGSGGSSYISSGSSGCNCNILIEPTLIADDSFDFYITNQSNCDIEIISIDYQYLGQVNTNVSLPVTIPVGELIQFLVVEEGSDQRGLVIFVTTDICGVLEFTVPIT